MSPRYWIYALRTRWADARVARRFRCLDCRIDTCEAQEYYMLRDDVWRAAVPNGKGMLCVGCVERRLGRDLVRDDIICIPMAPSPELSWPIVSERLWQRIGGAA